MSHYTDGFVIPLPIDKIPAYRSMAEQAGAVWIEHGALDFKECVLDDASTQMSLAFPDGLKLQPGETAIFSWILFESREHRDEVNAKVMADPRLQDMCGGSEMPFDVKRMLYGGFEVLVDLKPNRRTSALQP